MKNNIVLGELIDDKSFLIIKKEGINRLSVYVNYLDTRLKKYRVRESYIGNLGEEAIQFGYKSIAVITPSASNKVIKRIYDLNTHDFVEENKKRSFIREDFHLIIQLNQKKCREKLLWQVLKYKG